MVAGGASRLRCFDDALLRVFRLREHRSGRLAARIRVIHRESVGTYGVPRITAELHDTGHRVNHKRVARVMRGIGLAGLRLHRRHRTTLADPAAVKTPDLLGRDFTADTPTPGTSAT